MQCFNCDQPAEYLPRIKKGPMDWEVHLELVCCEGCSSVAVERIQEGREEPTSAIQMTHVPRTEYQWRAAMKPAEYAAEQRAKRLRAAPPEWVKQMLANT